MNKKTVSIGIIILFHIVGLAGFFILPLRPLFFQIVPFHILLMFGVVVYNHEPKNLNFTWFVALVSLLGFAAEWIGIHQHLIFGNYFYGETLGFKIFDIPPTIALNWLLLIYGTGMLTQYLHISNLNVRVILGAILLVLLDLIIEPVAVRFDYWHWLAHGGPLTAPFENYLGWFIMSGLLLGIFEAFKFTKRNLVAVVLLITQFAFFALLNCVR